MNIAFDKTGWEDYAYWSRRITDEHRLVYTVRGENLTIVQARYCY
ncbi:type II toxin-antitoxin system YoeB family toxin [Actinoplanes sp. NPDC023936]